jgi:hypothetical protein
MAPPVSSTMAFPYIRKLTNLYRYGAATPSGGAGRKCFENLDGSDTSTLEATRSAAAYKRGSYLIWHTFTPNTFRTLSATAS